MTEHDKHKLDSLVKSCLLELYDHRCQVCGVKSEPEYLDPHHIVSRSFLMTRWYLPNLILCHRECHTRIHNSPEVYPVPEELISHLKFTASLDARYIESDLIGLQIISLKMEFYKRNKLEN